MALFNFLLGRTEKKARFSSNNHKINSIGSLSTDAASMLQTPHPQEKKAIKIPFSRSTPLTQTR